MLSSVELGALRTKKNETERRSARVKRKNVKTTQMRRARKRTKLIELLACQKSGAILHNTHQRSRPRRMGKLSTTRCPGKRSATLNAQSYRKEFIRIAVSRLNRLLHDAITEKSELWILM